MIEKFFYCPLCDYTSITQRGIDTHLGRSHKEYYEVHKKGLLEEKQKSNTILCPYCEQKFSSISSLIKHTTRTHKISSQQTIIDYKYNGLHPTCKCGCGEMVKYDGGKADFNDYIKGHIARVSNNYQTEKSKTNSKKTKEERALLGVYKGVVKSEDHKEKIRQKSLLHRHSEESKDKMSESQKQWIKNNPEKAAYYNVQFWKDYWKDTEHREEQRERRSTFLSTYHHVSSKLEKTFERFLTELNILYEKQYKLKGKLYDFKIKDRNILIEVDGDFWHSNPDMFPDGPIYKVQKDNLERDIEKNKIAKEEEYELIRFWEHEVKYQEDIVIDRLKKLLQ